MRTFSLLLVASVATASALAAQKKPVTYVSPTNETVLSESEENLAGMPGHTIYVKNLSSVTVIVFGYSVTNCENVRESCTPKRVNIKVRPGTRRMIHRVTMKSENLAFRYRTSFSWRPDPTELQGVSVAGSGAGEGSADAAAGGGAATRVQEAIEGATARARGDYDNETLLDAAAIKELGARVAAIVAQPDSVPMQVGQSFLGRQVKILAMDSAGQVLGRVVALRWRYDRGVIAAAGDTIAAVQPGTALLEFSVPDFDRPLVAFLRIYVRPPDP